MCAKHSDVLFKKKEAVAACLVVPLWKFPARSQVSPVLGAVLCSIIQQHLILLHREETQRSQVPKLRGAATCSFFRHLKNMFATPSQVQPVLRAVLYGMIQQHLILLQREEMPETGAKTEGCRNVRFLLGCSWTMTLHCNPFQLTKALGPRILVSLC